MKLRSYIGKKIGLLKHSLCAPIFGSVATAGSTFSYS
jgi:hypothetical protein